MKAKVLKMIFYFIGALVLVVVLQMVIKNSITPSNIGITNGELAPLPKSPNCVSSFAIEKDKFVEPLPFVGDFETSKKQLLDAMKSYGEMEIITDEGSYVHVVFTTGKMKYHDDVELLFDLTLEKINYRSASRVGYSDMGLNKERYSAIKSDYLD